MDNETAHATRALLRDDHPSARRRETTQLFIDLESTTSEDRRCQLRQRIVEENMPVASAITRRYYGRGETQNDLDQVAYVGLVKAVNGFDPARKTDFLGYAVPTIAGEVKRHFRDHCWSVRPTRRIQELQAKIVAARERLMHALGRQPNTTDIAAELGVAEPDISEALSADGCFCPSSLDTPIAAEVPTPVSDAIGGCDTNFERCEGHLLLQHLLGNLTPRDREILRYRYVEDLSQSQIGERIGVTQMQVSRLLTRILRELETRTAA